MYLLKKLNISKIGLLPMVILALGLVYFVIQPRFGSIPNIKNILFQFGILGLLSFGQFFPVLTGGIDFTVRAQMALASVVGSLVMSQFGIFSGVIAAFFACMLVGLINGLIIVKLGTSPMVVTLGMLWALDGLVLVLSKGQVIYGLPLEFETIGISNIAGISIAAWWTFLALIICYFILHKTVHGYRFYAVGANEKTARLAGINVHFVKIVSYIICSIFACFAGLVLTAALGSGQPSLGTELGMQSFVAVFIAGVLWGGGEGRIVDVAFGALFVTILTNGLNVLNVSTFVQMIISGAMLVFALAVDMLGRRGVSLKKIIYVLIPKNKSVSN